MDRYELAQRVSNALSAPAGQHQEPRIHVTGNYYKGPNMKFDAQEMSTKKSTTMDNLKRQGVGVTRTNVTSPSYGNTKLGSAIQGKMYPPNVVNKAKSKIGYNSNVGVGGR